MTYQDLIKRNALEKLDGLILFEFMNYDNICKHLSEKSNLYFTKDEQQEIQSNIGFITESSQKFKEYCEDRGLKMK